MEVVDVSDDDDFLSKVEAAEASTKRRKLEAATTARDCEGSYTAALKGSKSLLWQQLQHRSTFNTPTTTTARSKSQGGVSASATTDYSSGTTDSSACFKCGKSGHWARDCSGSGGIEGGEGATVPEKPCPCGSGPCLVFTANTERNRGRKFYRCPVREENGGCSFFEWCDNSSVTNSVGGPNKLFNASASDLPCPCGAGACIVLTAKTERNMGQQFYRCPGNRGVSCDFFKWCSDQSPVAHVPASRSQVYSTWNDTSSQLSGGKSSSSCFKCGKEGHWARDCPKPSTDTIDAGGRSTPSNTCYKCGKTGHWARDCSSQEPTGSRKNSVPFCSPHGYKGK